jgi:hypothetical protein
MSGNVQRRDRAEALSRQEDRAIARDGVQLVVDGQPL